MNERDTHQYDIDFRTGRPTCINGDSLTESEWRGCSFLNRTRARAIVSAARQPTSREQVPADVWADTIARETKALDIPLIPLSAFGLFRDEIGILGSSEMTRLAEGKEAVAYLDTSSQCVYKFFNLYVDGDRGGLGQKLVFEMDGDFECSVQFVNADIFHVIEKLRILHDVGACPTEIVGLTELGYFLVAKQPFCGPYQNLDEDRKVATETIKASCSNWIIQTANCCVLGRR